MVSFHEDVSAVAAQATGHNRENTIDVEAIREWIGELFDDLDDEAERFPEEAEVAHWDLMAADHTTDEPLAVVVAIVADGELSLLGGQGEGEAHFDFGEADDFPEEAPEIAGAARTAFRMGPVTARIELEAARRWAAG